MCEPDFSVECSPGFRLRQPFLFGFFPIFRQSAAPPLTLQQLLGREYFPERARFPIKIQQFSVAAPVLFEQMLA
jgi:hypothetical protein